MGVKVLFEYAEELDCTRGEVRAYYVHGEIAAEHGSYGFDYVPVTGHIDIDDNGTLSDREHDDAIEKINAAGLKRWYKHAPTGRVFHAEECVHPNYGYKYWRCFDPVDGYDTRDTEYMLESEPRPIDLPA